MDIQKLYKNIQSAINQGNLIITQELMASSTYTAICTQYNLNKISCSGVVLQQVTNNQFLIQTKSVILYISDNEFSALPENANTVVFSVINNEPQLTISFGLTTDWQLGNAFPNLKGTYTDNLGLNYGSLNLSTLDVPFSGEDLQAGITLIATMDFTKSPYSYLKTLFPSIATENVGVEILSINPITNISIVSKAFKTINVLKATFANTQIGISDTEPKPTEEELEQGLQTTISMIPEINFFTQLDLGKSIKVDVTGQYPLVSKTVAMEGTLEQPLSLTNGLKDLVNLFSDSDLVSVLPKSIKDIGNEIALTSVGFSFYLDNKEALFSTESTLIIKQPFSVFPSLSIIEVESLSFTWYVYSPFNSKNRSINFYSTSQVKIGDTYEVDLTIGKNQASGYHLSLMSVKGQTLSLNEVLSHFKIPSNLLPSLGISQFQFSANISQEDYGFGLWTTENWNPISGLNISLDTVFLWCNYTKSTGTYAATATANFSLPSKTNFYIEANKTENNWTLNGSLQSEMPSLATFLGELNTVWDISNFLPSFLQDIEISDLGLTFQSNPESFQFQIISGLTVLSKSFGSTLNINIDKEETGYNATIDGTIFFANQLFELQAIHNPSDTSFVLTWQETNGNSLTLNEILTTLGLEEIQIPSGINLALGLTSVQLICNTQTEEISMLLKTTDNLDAYFLTTTIQGSRKYCFAVSLGTDFNLSNLSSDLSFLDAITLNQLSVVIADFTDANFQISIPGLSYAGVVDGIQLRTALTMQATQSANGGFKQIINFLESSFSGTTVYAGVDLSSTSFELIAEVNTNLDFPSSQENYLTLKEINLTVKDNPIYVNIGCNALLNFDFKSSPDVKSLDLTGSIFLEVNAQDEATIGASLSENTTISQPFGIPVVTLSDFGIAIEAQAGALSGVAFTLQGDVALQANGSSDPINEKFGATIAFEDEVVNIPYLASNTTGVITFQKLWNAFFPSVTFPSFVNAFQLNELDFYFCEEQQVLPDGTTVSPGISFLAATTIWNFSSFVNLIINTQSEKIAGDVEIDPINLKVGDTTVASVTGSGKGSTKYNITPGGAVIQFDTSTERFSASVDANILGLTESINASLSSSGLTIDFKQPIAGIASEQITVTFDNPLQMGFSCNINVGIPNCSPTIPPFGTLKIDPDTSVNGTLTVNIQDTAFTAIINGSFTWMGNKIPLVNANISRHLTSLNDLSSAIVAYIENNAESLFSKVFMNVTNYIEAIGKGLLTGGEFIVNVLYNHYSTSIDNLFQVLDGLPNGFKLNGEIDFDLNISPKIPSENIHADLPHLNVHADAGHGDIGHFDHSPLPSIHGDLGRVGGPHGDVNPSTTISTPSFNVNLLDIRANEHLDMNVPPTIHADAQSPHADVNPHLDIGIGGASFQAGGNVGVNSSVGLSDLDFDLHFNGDARAQFSVGSPHLSQHFDVGHADFSFVNIHGDLGHADLHADEHADTGPQHLDQGI